MIIEFQVVWPNEPGHPEQIWPTFLTQRANKTPEDPNHNWDQVRFIQIYEVQFFGEPKFELFLRSTLPNPFFHPEEPTQPDWTHELVKLVTTVPLNAETPSNEVYILSRPRLCIGVIKIIKEINRT